jgi:hypothetical protein
MQKFYGCMHHKFIINNYSNRLKSMEVEALAIETAERIDGIGAWAH